MGARKPTTDAEWALSVERRLLALERPTLGRVGSWTLFEADDGSLQGQNSRTGQSFVLSPLPEGETGAPGVEP